MNKAKFVAGLLVTVLLTLGLALPAVANGPVEPPAVEAELPPGGSMNVSKEVTTPTLLPTADVVLSTDLTTSMGGELANLKSEIGNIMTALSGASADLNVGVVSHEDYPAAYNSCGYAATYGSNVSGDEPFRVDYPVGDNFTAASQAVQNMTLKGGQDWPESYARVMWESGHADNLMGYRTDAQKILVMFLDAVPHDCGLNTTSGVDPGRDELAGTADDIDVEDAAIPSMTGAGVTLLVVYSGPMPDDSPGPWTPDDLALWEDVAEATGGSAVRINQDGTVPGGTSLSELILDLIEEIRTDVWWEVETDSDLAVELDPAVHYDVAGNTTVEFLESISVSDGAPQCETLEATVTFYANSYPEEGEVIGTQKISVQVLDIVPPGVKCIESVNPHGRTVPPAGKTTLPGPRGGQNEDGFYQLLAEDNCDPEPDIYVSYVGADPMLFGPFMSGIVVKFTEAPGATPSCKKIGSTNGQAGAVAYHITLPSDPVIYAYDASGNVRRCQCLVPPLPK